ncbi:MAG: hypothetical protein HC841_06690 [Verrucomicrobiae bacterium]|nr:hypothetical protein [Verrucomicrobiae bacterium]
MHEPAQLDDHDGRIGIPSEHIERQRLTANLLKFPSLELARGIDGNVLTGRDRIVNAVDRTADFFLGPIPLAVEGRRDRQRPHLIHDPLVLLIHRRVANEPRMMALEPDGARHKKRIGQRRVVEHQK